MIAGWLECLRVELGALDASGRPAPMPVTGSEFLLPADQIVKAVGQKKPALAALLGLETEMGFIAVDSDFQTSIAGRLCHWRLHSRFRRGFDRDGRSGWQASCRGNSSTACPPSNEG